MLWLIHLKQIAILNVNHALKIAYMDVFLVGLDITYKLLIVKAANKIVLPAL